MSNLRLTQRELDIMSVLWELGEATVNEVRDRVDPDLAYTSVSTMVRMLELKGYVSHRRGEGKTHVYFPTIKAEKAGESALGRVLDKIYGGSPIRLLAHLVEQNRPSEKELARMRQLLKRPAKRK
ncbi:MAG TPA: BlaI/MecI/CopY family transcriptional regulator [Gemmatimonadaceae bacterium]